MHFCLKGRDRDKETEISHLLFHSPNAFISWDRLKAEFRNSSKGLPFTLSPACCVPAHLACVPSDHCTLPLVSGALQYVLCWEHPSPGVSLGQLLFVPGLQLTWHLFREAPEFSTPACYSSVSYLVESSPQHHTRYDKPLKYYTCLLA